MNLTSYDLHSPVKQILSTPNCCKMIQTPSNWNFLINRECPYGFSKGHNQGKVKVSKENTKCLIIWYSISSKNFYFYWWLCDPVSVQFCSFQLSRTAEILALDKQSLTAQFHHHQINPRSLNCSSFLQTRKLKYMWSNDWIERAKYKRLMWCVKH